MIVCIVWLTFRPVHKAEFLYLLVLFFVVTLLAGGSVLAFSFFRRPASVSAVNIVELSFPFFLVAIVLLFFLLFLLRPFLESRKLSFLYNLSISISYQGHLEENIPAMLDTGNHLREPFLNRPVVIVHYKALKKVLPEKVYQLYMEGKAEKPDLMKDLLYNHTLAFCFRLITYSSLGGRSGSLLSFRPDNIEIRDNGQLLRSEPNVVIGIESSLFGFSGEYKALLPPETLRANNLS